MIAKTMSSRKRNKKIAGLCARYFFLVLFCLFFLFPFVYLVSKGFFANSEPLIPIKLFPSFLSIDGYRYVFSLSVLRYFKNTVIVIVSNCILIPLSSSLCAFGFSKIKWQGREFFFGVVLATMMLPAMAIQVPLYIMYTRINWIGTLWPLIVPAAFGGGAFNIFLLRQFMKNVPNDILNAAKIDGATLIRIFFQLTIPLCMPIIIFIMVTTFFGCWNDFMGPIMFLGINDKNYTLAVAIYLNFVKSSTVYIHENANMAIGTLMIVPPIILFFIFQKQLLSGLNLGAIKG